jgi:Uma2 family endonuclease
MSATGPVRESLPFRNGHQGSLENGYHLSAFEFLRRYEACPEIIKAELVNGIVYMASPVRFDLHGMPDSLVQTWLGHYCLATAGVRSAANSTVRLSSDDVVQPDGLLLIPPESGGSARPDDKGYLLGPPELIVEIAASTVSLDAREKFASYRRAGVREYLLWRTADAEIDWWVLEQDEYRPLSPTPKGVLCSKIFPGLWLDTAALLAGDGKRVITILDEGLSTPEHADFVAKLQQQQSR